MGDDYDVCDAARVSFNKTATRYDEAANQKLLDYLAKHDHWSPFSHVMLKFRFLAPMFIARQFQKHTVGFAWNEVSRRYVDEDPLFWIPETFRKKAENKKQGSTQEGETPVTGEVLDEYMAYMDEATLQYRALKQKNICPEQIRALMPQAMLTEWIWTGSLWAWVRFCTLRIGDHAQHECKDYAKEVVRKIKKHFPMCFAALDCYRP